MKQFYQFALVLLALLVVSCSDVEEFSQDTSTSEIVTNGISIDEAQEKLEEVLNAMYATTRGLSDIYSTKVSSRFSTKGLTTRANDGDSSFVYVFNIGNKEVCHYV